MEYKKRTIGNGDESVRSIEDVKERSAPTSRLKAEDATDMSSSRDKGARSSTSDDTTIADKKLVQDVLKRYTESLVARNRARMTGDRKRKAQKLPGNAQPLDSDADSNRKKQKLLDIEHPLDPDVLFGRRDAQRFHPGNVLLRALCDTYRDEYENGDREVKTVVKKRIFDEIGSKGGRFLKRRAGETVWYCVDEEVALEKVAFTMRDTRDKKKPPPS